MYLYYFTDRMGDGSNACDDLAYLEMQPSKRSFRLVAECPLAGAGISGDSLCSLLLNSEQDDNRLIA